MNAYLDSLREIFERLRAAGGEVIFLSENMMNTSVNYNELRSQFVSIAENTAKIQNEGILAEYFEGAVRVARECSCSVCDVYSKWKILHERGVDTNRLLSGAINHPIRQTHYIFAYSILDTLMEQ